MAGAWRREAGRPAGLLAWAFGHGSARGRSIYKRRAAGYLKKKGGGLEREIDALAGADALEVGLLIAGNVVVADVQLCQRPDGKKYIRGGTGDILVLTGTWEGKKRA